MVAVDAVRDIPKIPYRASRYDAGGSGSASGVVAIGASDICLTSSVGQFGVDRTTRHREAIAGSRAAMWRYARHMITAMVIHQMANNSHNSG
jgi:hypothetical protein